MEAVSTNNTANFSHRGSAQGPGHLNVDLRQNSYLNAGPLHTCKPRVSILF